MTNCIFLVLTTFLGQLCYGQKGQVRVYDEEQPDGKVFVKADNDEYHLVSVELTLDLKGIRTEHQSADYLVLKPNTKGQILVVLTPIPGKSWSYKSSFKTHFGNVNMTTYDTNFVYELPLAPHSEVYISQGYFGKISHGNEYALDFDLDNGTPIYAARGGKVVKTVDIHNKSCPNASCAAFNNYILIEHNDGSYADYAHLMKNGASVKSGQEVAQGELIGYSGNTGWATGPHLHFSVFLPTVNKRQTVPTLFNIHSDKAARLVEGISYARP